MKNQVLLLSFLSVFVFSANAQRNLAYLGTPNHSGGGATSFGFGPENYNDTVIAPGTSQPWGWVSTNGWIEYTWTNPVSFQDIVFYHGTRKVTGGEIQYWDDVTSSYVTIVSNLASLLTPGNEDTVSLPTRVTSTRLRFNNLSGANPNFREIEVYEAPSGLHDAGVVSVEPLSAVCSATIPVSATIQNYGLNQIDSVLVNWTVNGVAQTSVMYNSLLDTINGLNPSSALVNLGNYSFQANSTYQLEIWTSLPNNANDTTNYNDTLSTLIRLPAPTGFSVMNVLPTSADFSWNTLGATNFRLIYGLPGFNPQISGTSVNATGGGTTVTSFSPNTAYQAYLVADCGSSTFSDTAGPISFRTPCSIFTAPYSENFDGNSWVAGSSTGAGDTLDPCWSRNSESGYKWSVYNSSTSSSSTGPDQDHTGGNFLYTEASSSTPDSAILITPLIDVSGLTVPYLSFFYHRFGTTAAMGDMDIDVNDGSGWVNLFTLTGTDQTSATDPYVQRGTDLSAFGDTLQLRFVGLQKATFQGDMAIDLIEVKEAPPCPILSGLDTISVGDTSVVLTWNASAKASQYELWYGPQGFFQGTQSTGGTKVLVSNDTTTLTGLSASTCYEVLLRSICAPNDSSGWIGPVSFCTNLSYDVEFVDLLVPDGCGAASSDVAAVIRNNGDSAISNISINVNLSGSINNNFSANYTSVLTMGDMDTVVMGSINTVNGGVISYDGILSQSSDQVSANDSIRKDSVFTIPLNPLANDTAFCTNQDTATILAFPVPGVSYNWFASSTDTVPLFTGNPFEVPTATAQSSYYVEYSSNSDSLTTQFSGNTTCAGGNMFDLEAINTVSITGFALHFATAGAAKSVDVYYIPNNTWSSNPTTPSAWTSAGTYSVNSNGPLTGSPFSLNSPITIPAGQTYAFYIVFDARYSSGAVNTQNADLKFLAGNGNCTAFDNCCIPRTFDGKIYYGSTACSNSRTQVNLTIGSDTATAAFSVSGVGQSKTFDASASTNADHYAWDFGDGSTGTGMTTNHTYAALGTYTVTLTVSDSTDCYSTAVEDTTFLINIGLEENPLARSLEIYPNPTAGTINISFSADNSGTAEVVMVDLAGKEVMRLSRKVLNGTFEETIDLSKLADGTYMLKVSKAELEVIRRIVKN